LATKRCLDAIKPLATWKMESGVTVVMEYLLVNIDIRFSGAAPLVDITYCFLLASIPVDRCLHQEKYPHVPYSFLI